MATKYEYYDCGASGHAYYPYDQNRYAQTFTPGANHTCTQVAIRVFQRGTSPTPYTVAVYATSGGLPTGSALASATFIATDITSNTDGEMKLVTLDDSTNLLSGVVYAIVLSGVLEEGDTNNCLGWLFGGWGNGNPYADGQVCKLVPPAGWAAESGYDFGFEEWGDVWTLTNPSVTIQAVTDIVSTTATGNGNVTDLGDPAATQHGHCWNTTGTPTTSDDKTTNGVPSATGAFTSSLTGLTSATLYYVRAYATNSVGTSYSGEVNFTAGAPGSSEVAGAIVVVETRLHYLDAYGQERYIEGKKIKKK